MIDRSIRRPCTPTSCRRHRCAIGGFRRRVDRGTRRVARDRRPCRRSVPPMPMPMPMPMPSRSLTATPDTVVASFLRRIGPWLLWRAGPAWAGGLLGRPRRRPAPHPHAGDRRRRRPRWHRPERRGPRPLPFVEGRPPRPSVTGRSRGRVPTSRDVHGSRRRSHRVTSAGLRECGGFPDSWPHATLARCPGSSPPLRRCCRVGNFAYPATS